MVVAVALPRLVGWDVHARSQPDGAFPPLSATWEPKVGVGTMPAVAIALIGWRYAVDWAS
jgi:hypothetical protein